MMARRFQHNRKYGFTSIEIVTSAAIIALLALALVPVVRDRLDEAKLTAAQDDMSQLQKAEEIAFAHTGFYFRPVDLARPSLTAEEKNLTATQIRNLGKIPDMFWDRPMTDVELVRIAKTWAGPYYRIQRGITIQQLVENLPHLWRGTIPSGSGITVTLGRGPLILGADDDEDWEYPDGGALRSRKYPTDPWGNPYIFFGSGIIDQGANPQLPSSGSNNLPVPYAFSGCVVYSLGPDGIAGNSTLNGSSVDPRDYFRESAFTDPKDARLGGGDDLVREF